MRAPEPLSPQRPIYVYPHLYLRDRHLDTIRYLGEHSQVVNLNHFLNRKGQHVEQKKALNRGNTLPLSQRLPLLNIKWRPRDAPRDSVVYLWGGMLASGSHIIELDNPYALTGYNTTAMRLYQPIIKRLLLRGTCQQIRCLSQACQETLTSLFGDAVAQKSLVQYPFLKPSAQTRSAAPKDLKCLFIGSQFEIKGGPPFLRALRKVVDGGVKLTLDLVTYLPDEYRALADHPAITHHEPRFSRDELTQRFYSQCDLLIHPTYAESFGMVVLEALANGMAIIGTDVYAMSEMIVPKRNGYLLDPPISVWNDRMPSAYFPGQKYLSNGLLELDTLNFERQLEEVLRKLANDRALTDSFRGESRRIFAERFQVSGWE